MARIKKFTRYTMEETMTVRELRDALADVPADTEVLIEFETLGLDDSSDTIEDAEVGSVHYDADEKTFTIKEAL